mgnify:CR=1 FL=1|tara:strand:- start:21980 stop:22153 length:174 start_codon:yes stop_codon:yes gene_type:complete
MTEKMTINLTPTWTGLLRPLVELAMNATTQEARDHAWEELYRLAAFADQHNEQAEEI